MPGRIIDVFVASGDFVTQNQVCLVLEAMKVQMRLLAPQDATVASVKVKPGDIVSEGAELLTFED